MLSRGATQMKVKSQFNCKEIPVRQFDKIESAWIPISLFTWAIFKNIGPKQTKERLYLEVNAHNEGSES